MKQRILIAVTVVVFIVFGAIANCMPGLDYEAYILPEKVLKKLSPEAVEAYESAIHALDHIDYEGAIEYFEKATLLNPESIDLQFVLAKICVRRGRLKYGAEATGLYRNAISAYNEIIRNPRAGKQQIVRARNQKRLAEEAKDKIAELDQRRMTLGRLIIANKILGRKLVEEEAERRAKEAAKLLKEAAKNPTRRSRGSTGGSRGSSRGRGR